jgi:hypothetical protein
MIDPETLYLTYYCHANCAPLQNIMRLPKEEAYVLARQMAESNPETTAFYRFSDFENYYPRRMKADRLLYAAFTALGGKPENEHPLSFVLQDSDYLYQWFDRGAVIRLPLRNVPAESISFTYGDSTAAIEKNESIAVMSKEMLLRSIREYDGTWDAYMQQIVKNHRYIEAQLWNDSCCFV